MKINLLLICLITCYSYSQEILSLEKAIEYGIMNSNDIAIVKNDASIIKNNNHIGNAGLLPNIAITSGYNTSITSDKSELNDSIPDGFSSFISEDILNSANSKTINMSASIGLTYRLFSGFRGMYTLSKFKQQNIIADENIRYQVELKIIEIVNQYYDLLNKKNIHDIFKKSYDISLDRYNQAQSQYELGSLSTKDMLNIEVLLNEDKIRLDESFINMNSSKLNLALTIGKSEKSFSINQEFNFNNNMNIEDLLSKMNTNNSSILIADLNYQIAQNEIKLAKSSFLPTVNLVSSYGYNNINFGSGLYDSQQDFGFRGGVNIEIPLFSSNMRRKNLQNAKINLDSRSHALDEMKSTIKTSLLNAYYSYQDGLSSLQLMEKNLDTAEKNYNINKELYEVGQLSNLEYREAQLQLEQIRINYSVKLSTTKMQEYIIYQLSGQLKRN
ncbi:MAG: hypothetical protein CMD26_03485 [Flavobacteriales bacterium]|nr:hypothetical protein [Flavobacteriales bacterium]